MRAATSGSGAGVLIDGHTHLHDVFDVATFLENADRNLRAGAGAEGVTATLVAATDDRPPLRRLTDPGATLPDGWEASAGDDGMTVSFSVGGRIRSVALGGQQLRTHDRLELLLFGGTGAVSGRAFDETLRAALDAAPLVVVPWAFGKWLGRRGRQVYRALTSLPAGDRERVLAGDNANRPASHGVPAALTRLRDAGFGILPGSDPFPFADEVERVGTFGSSLPGAFDPADPLGSVAAALSGSDGESAVVGRPMSWSGFVRNQVRVRLPARRR